MTHPRGTQLPFQALQATPQAAWKPISNFWLSTHADSLLVVAPVCFFQGWVFIRRGLGQSWAIKGCAAVKAVTRHSTRVGGTPSKLIEWTRILQRSR